MSKPEFVNGEPVSVTHLYMDRRGGQFRWWTERESLTGWGERVESAREQGDPRFNDASANHIPSTVAHTIDDGDGADYISIYYSHENPRKYKAAAGDSRSESGPIRIKHEATYRRKRENPAGEGEAHTDRSEAKPRWKKTGSIRSRPYKDRKEKFFFHGSGSEAKPRWNWDGKKKYFFSGSGEEKLYKDIGVSPADFNEATERLRNELEGERKLRGKSFNSTEHLRSWIEENMKQLVEEVFKRGNDQRQDELDLFQDLWRGWDYLAFDRFGPQTQEAVLDEHEGDFERMISEEKTRVSKKAAAMLDIMASATMIRHIPGEQEIPVSPAMRKRAYEM